MGTPAAVIGLADLTTTRVGGPVGQFLRAYSQAEVIEAIQTADQAGDGLLVIGGGSNILAADDGFPGTVVQDRCQAVTVGGHGDRVRLTADAGLAWDALVSRALQSGWSGFEALAGIPGSVGATLVQNVGAYGHEVAELVTGALAWDRQRRTIVRLGPCDLAFGYRTSSLKRSQRSGQWGPTPRWVILQVEFEVQAGRQSAPITYRELAEHLALPLGAVAPAEVVARAVIDLRRAKGMVVDQADPESWSSGSFFTNPIISAAQAAAVPAEAPRYRVEAGSDLPADLQAANRASLVKIPAAWLITAAGIAKGWSLGTPARVSRKHPLALVNGGGASGADMMALALAVQGRVREAFGISLEIEPTLVGFGPG